MGNLADVGRIFYGIAIAGMGVQTIYYDNLPYMLVPPTHFTASILTVLAYISGILFILAGACIVLKKRPRSISLLLGTVLLLIFCCYYIPYELMTNSNYMHLGEWENAEKELALSSGAFVIAGCFSEKKENFFFQVVGKANSFGGCFLLYNYNQFWH